MGIVPVVRLGMNDPPTALVGFSADLQKADKHFQRRQLSHAVPEVKDGSLSFVAQIDNTFNAVLKAFSRS